MLTLNDFLLDCLFSFFLYLSLSILRLYSPSFSFSFYLRPIFFFRQPAPIFHSIWLSFFFLFSFSVVFPVHPCIFFLSFTPAVSLLFLSFLAFHLPSQKQTQKENEIITIILKTRRRNTRIGKVRELMVETKKEV